MVRKTKRRKSVRRKSSGARRTKVGKFYVRRDKNGRFKKWSRIGKSLKADRRTRAKKRVKRKGQGHKGDYKKRRTSRRKTSRRR